MPAPSIPSFSYTFSNAVAGRGSVLAYSTNPPSVGYTVWLELKKAGFSGAKYDLEDVSNFQSSNFKEWLPTMADSGDVTFEGNMLPNDQSENDVIGFFNTATRVTWQLILPAAPDQGYPTSLGVFTFRAYVASIDRDIEVAKAMTVSGKLKITGAISYTAGG